MRRESSSLTSNGAGRSPIGPGAREGRRFYNDNKYKRAKPTNVPVSDFFVCFPRISGMVNDEASKRRQCAVSWTWACMYHCIFSFTREGLRR